MSFRRRPQRGKTLLLSAVAVVLLGIAASAGPALAADELAIEIVGFDDEAFPDVAIDIALPPELAGRTLTAGNFIVAEGGRRVSAAVWAAAEQPMEVLLLIDTSGSMEGAALDAARTAALGFVDRIPASADVGVVAFGDEVTVAATIDAGRSAAEAALRELSAAGETALFDAVAATAAEFGADSDIRRVVVVLSDGGDTVSETSLDEAAVALASTDAEVFAVALESSDTDRDALADLVRPAGGEVVETGDVAELADLYAGIADEILGRYTLTYASEATGPTVVAVGVTFAGMTAVGSVEADFPVTSTTIAGAAPGDPEPAVTTTAATAPAGAEAPQPEIVPEPGLLGGPWTLWAGAGAVAAAALVAVLLLLKPGREGRAPLEEVVPAVSGGARGLLSFLSRGAESAAEEVLRHRKATGLDAALDRAGIRLRPAEFIVIGAAVAVSGTAVGLTLGGPIGGILFGVPAVASPKIALRVMTKRRRDAFSDQLESTLQMMASSLRAGYGLLQSIKTAAAESPSPTAEEFERVIVENRLGRPLVQSLASMADRMDDDDLRWVVEAIDIQQEVGGNLAEVLDTVNGTIRERNQIRRQISALSAEGRMSAIILLALPFGLAALIASISPDYISELTSTNLGRILMVVGLVMMGLGAAWIRRIVKVVF